MSAVRCAVGLLTWNGERDVARCVESVLAQSERAKRGLELYWIDNGSKDGTVARVRAALGKADIEEELLAENIGFCEGHNRMFARSRGPYYLALNQDAVLAEDYVERLCDWMDEEAELAAASGLILHMEGAAFRRDAPIYSAGQAMTRRRFPFELAMGLAQTPELMAKIAGRRRVPGVTGAAMMVRRSAVEPLGVEGRLFPPKFFAYFEEVDLALRIARAGLACGVDGGALAWHAARGQGGAGDPRVRAHYFKNHWLVTLRHGRARDLARDLPWIAWGEARHYAAEYLRSPGAAARAAGGMMADAARRNLRVPNGVKKGRRGLSADESARIREYFEASRRAIQELDDA